MEWIKQAVAAFVSEFEEGRALQRSGVVSKATLLAFFENGRAMFDDEDVKQRLRDAHAKHKNILDMINECQKHIFEALGVQGDFGIQFLGQVRRVYGSDVEVMKEFFDFVHREESLADEVELPPEAYVQKLETETRLREELSKHADTLQALTPEEQQKFLQDLFGKQRPLHYHPPESMDTAPPVSNLSVQEQMNFFKGLSTHKQDV